MNNIIYFIDNIEKAIELQTQYLFYEIKKQNEKCTNRVTICDDTISVGEKIHIKVSGQQLTVNKSTTNEQINNLIKKNIEQLIETYDLVQLVIDCNLDESDNQNTSLQLINYLVQTFKNKLEKIIITIVSAHYFIDDHRTKIIDFINPKIRKKIKFLSRPMGRSDLGETYWDDKRTSNGKYELADTLYNMNTTDRKFEVIEEMLYESTESANYFGAILVRFLRNENIENSL